MNLNIIVEHAVFVAVAHDKFERVRRCEILELNQRVLTVTE